MFFICVFFVDFVDQQLCKQAIEGLYLKCEESGRQIAIEDLLFVIVLSMWEILRSSSGSILDCLNIVEFAGSAGVYKGDQCVAAK